MDLYTNLKEEEFEVENLCEEIRLRIIGSNDFLTDLLKSFNVKFGFTLSQNI